ncbi:hypothetical protein cce_3076 [Crocosphaera subtropica ATCC 51142]|uniref:PEP-CTERM protein-sorting domain-containing protein n=1 Tax=Crocosphaera subtropica (strain ATCC 51142 / BH68) TaxID=43989 RepID=B1WWV5_CROS5|nr:hypothetical protein [Crocosphaera subtropica]ACB52424.1 hypothetical protein cce_3076 [Crocosphaera subtropica ATCC 51142]
MLKPLQKITLAASGVAFSLVTALYANPTQAATVAYDFSVSIPDGTYGGFFEYDDEGLSSSGFDQVSVSEFFFDFLGVEYTEVDVPDATVDFQDGSFIALSIPGDNTPFTFVPPSLSGGDSLFVVPEDQIVGNITYTLVEQPPEAPPENPAVSVPEPSSGVALLMLAPLGIIRGLKKQQ